MLFTAAIIDGLAQRLDGPVDRLRIAAVDHPGPISPAAFVRATARVFGSAVTFATPDGFEMGGVGVAWRFAAGGPERFERLRNGLTLARLPDAVRLAVGYSYASDGPRSEEWEGFDPAVLVLPQLAVIREGGKTRVIAALPAGASMKRLIEVMLTHDVEPEPLYPDAGDHSVESRPPSSQWREEVAEAVAGIRAGAMQKVVLARSVAVSTQAPIDGFDLLHHLERQHPQCYPYGWQVGGASFIGASPELLVQRRGMAVRTNPLAGTDRRGTGDDEDRAVGAALMSSAKNRDEHSLVIEDVARRLRTVTSELHVPPSPSLRRIATVQHLSTEITGTLAAPHHLLDLVALLHPTPAVGGTPRADATAFIEKAEGIDRGWYSGGVGWLTPGGDGDVAIALRCGLIRDSTALVYAGNGIVANSDPDEELAETRLKLRPLLDLLTAS